MFVEADEAWLDPLLVVFVPYHNSHVLGRRFKICYWRTVFFSKNQLAQSRGGIIPMIYCDMMRAAGMCCIFLLLFSFCLHICTNVTSGAGNSVWPTYAGAKTGYSKKPPSCPTNSILPRPGERSKDVCPRHQGEMTSKCLVRLVVYLAITRPCLFWPQGNRQEAFWEVRSTFAHCPEALAITGTSSVSAPVPEEIHCFTDSQKCVRYTLPGLTLLCTCSVFFIQFIVGLMMSTATAHPWQSTGFLNRS